MRLSKRLPVAAVLAAMWIGLAVGCAKPSKPDEPQQMFKTLERLEKQVAEIPDTEKRDELVETIRLLQVQLQYGDVEMPPAAGLMLVKSIQILPVTQAGDWNEDGEVDGFEVYVEALDHFGDSTKAVGTFRFELFPYRPAHADPRELKPAGTWEVRIETAEQAVRYWDRFSRNYHFNLVLKNMPDVGQQYIFQATYVTPWGKTITDQRTLKRVK